MDIFVRMLSDHFPVEGKIKRKHGKENPEDDRKKLNKRKETIRNYKLRNEEITRRYEETVESKIAKSKKELNSAHTEELWEILRNIIVETAKKICGT